MADIRTEPQVQKLVDAVQGDLNDAADLLQQGLEVLRLLEPVTKGVNGLSAFLKGKGNELEKMIGDVQAESEAVAKKMLGEPKKETVKVVHDAEHAEQVRAAKEAAQ